MLANCEADESHRTSYEFYQYIYALEEIPKHQTLSKEFDPEYKPTERKYRPIPPMSHPWKQQSFERFVRSQKHHLEDNPKTV